MQGVKSYPSVMGTYHFQMKWVPWWGLWYLFNTRSVNAKTSHWACALVYQMHTNAKNHKFHIFFNIIIICMVDVSTTELALTANTVDASSWYSCEMTLAPNLSVGFQVKVYACLAYLHRSVRVLKLWCSMIDLTWSWVYFSTAAGGPGTGVGSSADIISR